MKTNTFETPFKPVAEDAAAMENTSFESFAVTPMTPVLGAEIEGIDLSSPLSDKQVPDLHDALLQYQVLFFRDQHMSRDQHKDLGRCFGTLHCHPADDAAGNDQRRSAFLSDSYQQIRS